jgi:hypothetical protein
MSESWAILFPVGLLLSCRGQSMAFLSLYRRTWKSWFRRCTTCTFPTNHQHHKRQTSSQWQSPPLSHVITYDNQCHHQSQQRDDIRRNHIIIPLSTAGQFKWIIHREDGWRESGHLCVCTTRPSFEINVITLDEEYLHFVTFLILKFYQFTSIYFKTCPWISP